MLSRYPLPFRAKWNKGTLFPLFTFSELGLCSLNEKLYLSNKKQCVMFFISLVYILFGEIKLQTKEIQSLQQYLRKLFKNDEITIKAPESKDAPAEVSVGKEFIGVIYRNFDEGELSYDFNMAILPEDLEE